jgi:hypothetical protein
MGRPVNLGEVLAQGTQTEIKVTTDLQAYGLIITAEPYFAVTMPSDLVVLQNYVLPDKTQGIIEQITPMRHCCRAGLTPDGRPARGLESGQAMTRVSAGIVRGNQRGADRAGQWGGSVRAGSLPARPAGSLTNAQDDRQEGRPQGADHVTLAKPSQSGGRRAHHHHPQEGGAGQGANRSGQERRSAGGAGRASSGGAISRHWRPSRAQADAKRLLAQAQGASPGPGSNAQAARRRNRARSRQPSRPSKCAKS